jgi:hypothetical protein
METSTWLAANSEPGLGPCHREGASRRRNQHGLFLAHVSGRRHATVIGFDNREDVDRAMPLLKAAAAPRSPQQSPRGAAKSIRKLAPAPPIAEMTWPLEPLHG